MSGFNDAQGSLFNDAEPPSAPHGAESQESSPRECPFGLPPILSRSAAERLVEENESLRAEVESLRTEIEDARRALAVAEGESLEERFRTAELCCAFELEISHLRAALDARSRPKLEFEFDTETEIDAEIEVVRFTPIRRLASG